MMSQSLASVPPQMVNPEGTQEGKNTCHLAVIRLQPLPTVNPEKSQDVKAEDTGPQTAEVHIKGMISVSLASCIFPYMEKC